MIRISVSELETVRYWHMREDASFDDLIADLTKKVSPTPQMEAGRALAKLFERATPSDYVTAEQDGWSFDFSKLDAEMPISPMRELKGEKIYKTPAGDVTLVGVVDGMVAKHVRDQKLTERWDAEKYTDSLQWRAYLDMFEADAFTYDVFVGRYNLGDDRPAARSFDTYDHGIGDDGPPPAKWVEVTDYHQLTFYRYPDMRRDVVGAVTELATIISMHIPERVQP